MHHGHHTQTQTIDGTEQFSYDDNGRLITVNKQRRATGDYYYDPMGNITDMEESGFAYQQNYNALNQAQTHDYDANGNLINDGQFAYTWDAENRLIRIQNHATNAVSEFSYDAYSRRVQEIQTDASGQSNTTYNLWCGETLCAQTNEQGQITHRYFNQGEWHNGQVYFYAQDQIGSVAAMIDAQGKIAGTALYSPYGKLLQSEGVQANMAYAGLYHHQNSGLYLATYRGYNPFTARWLNRDPIEENGGLNLYEYVGGDPVLKIDASGLFPTVGIPSGSFGAGNAVVGMAMNGHKQAGAVYASALNPMAGPFGPVCGAEGSILATWIPDGIWKDACQQHDDCYATCGKTKEQCDSEFKRNGAPELYYQAVDKFGSGAFVNARKGCANCEK